MREILSITSSTRLPFTQLMDLPNEVLIHSLNYLEMGDIGNLDTSMSGIAMRSRFLQSISCRYSTFLGLSPGYSGDLYFSWIALRGVAVRNVSCQSSITSSGLKNLAGRCGKLESFSIGAECRTVDETLVNEILRSSPLRSLTVNSFNTHIYDATLLKISENCKFLQTLDLINCRNVTDVSVINLAKNCKNNLKTFHLSSSGLTDTSIMILAENCTQLSSLRNVSECNAITDRSILSIVTHCSNLLHFQLSSTNITDASIINLAKENGKKLITLNLAECSITDTAVHSIANHCKMVEKLVLGKSSDNLDITDSSISKVALKCKYLRSLHLDQCVNITDESLKSIANYCASQLQELILFCCYEITDDGVTALANKCISLKNLDISKCYNITDASVLQVLNKCPISDFAAYDNDNITVDVTTFLRVTT